MQGLQKFDKESLNIREYFEPMRIVESAKEQRTELADAIMDVVFLFYSTFLTFMEKGIDNKQYLVDMLNDSLVGEVLKITGMDDYLSEHLRESSQSIVDTTYEKFAYTKPLIHSTKDGLSDISPLDVGNPTPNTTEYSDIESDANSYSYWLSDRRAYFIATNEANNILNYSDYIDAVYEGKTKKVWQTMNDNRVRKSHDIADGMTVDIDDYFVVGKSALRFPCDTSLGAEPEEVIGCRCSVSYI